MTVGSRIIRDVLLIAMKMELWQRLNQFREPTISHIASVQIERFHLLHSVDLLEPGVGDRYIDKMQKTQRTHFCNRFQGCVGQIWAADSQQN